MTEEILNRQRAFFRSGKTLSADFRKLYLKALKQTVLEMQDEIGEALKTDLGKSHAESYMCETGLTLSEIRYALKNISGLSRKRRVSTPLAQFPARSYIMPEPYGNVLIMSPWNYPFLLCLSPLVSAVAAGNTAIIKPSAYSPATSALIRRIIGKVFPEEYVAVIEGGREVNAGLLEQKFDYIFFTGSKSVGKIVMSKAAAHLTPVTLELGGKSPVIVTPSAEIKVSADRIVFGKFLNCGQTCVAPDYVFVHESIVNEFLEACRESVRKMFGEEPLKNPDYGKIVNRKHYDRLCLAIDQALTAQHNNHGTSISETCTEESLATQNTTKTEAFIKGERDENALKIAPTIVRIGQVNDPETDSLTLMQDEIFGPVMPVLTYSDIRDVIDYIDQRPRPLATYIFTSDRRQKKELLEKLHFGGGCINDTIIHLATDNMPFGGVGESGMGNYHGKFGFDTFSHMKSIVDKPVWLDLPMRYQPYTALKERLVKMFLK